MKKTLSLFCFLLISSGLHAEIEKYAIPDEKCGKICFYWWPKLPTVEGWHHDKQQSYAFSANAQAPNGFTFANAETVIYAKALFKPRMPETKTLEKLIINDHNRFKTETDVIIKKSKSFITSDKNNLISYTFSPKVKGNWEHVSYGEEGEFFLIFTISSRSKSGLEKAMKTYEEYISRYNEKP